MPWRGLLYLALIAALHFLIYGLIGRVALTVPFFSGWSHLLLFTPLFACVIWLAIAALTTALSLKSPTANRRKFNGLAILAGVAWGFITVTAIVTGLTTPTEAFTLSTVALICLHIWLIRADLRRKPRR